MIRIICLVQGTGNLQKTAKKSKSSHSAVLPEGYMPFKAYCFQSPRTPYNKSLFRTVMIDAVGRGVARDTLKKYCCSSEFVCKVW